MAMAVPYKQGSLDPLCGIYAIINAVQTAAPAPGLNRTECLELFGTIADAISESWNIARVVWGGVGRSGVGCGLRVADSWLQEKHGWQLRWQWPFYRSSETSWPVMLDRMAGHLIRPQTAVIVGVGGVLDHWTVVRTIDRKRVWLHDSDGHSYIMLRSAGSAADEGRRYQFWPTFLVLVSIGGCE